MKLEEILKSPEECYKVGKSKVRTWWHRKHMDEIVARMTDRTWQARGRSQIYLSGKDWPDSIFNRYSEKIAEAAASDPYGSLLAGMNWSDERFDRYADQIIAGVVKNGSYNACEKWKIERVRAHAEKLSETLLHDYSDIEEIENLSEERFDILAPYIKKFQPDHARWAGIHWNDKRFERFEELIVQATTSNTEVAYAAGLRWNYARFNKHADRIIQSVQQSARYIIEAATSWSEARKQILQKSLTQEYRNLVTILTNIDKAYHDTAFEFTDIIGVKRVSMMSQTDFNNAAEAYEFAKGVDMKLKFFKGLMESADKGTVSKWAKTIIKYFRDNAKGAGNYRMIEVAA